MTHRDNSTSDKCSIGARIKIKWGITSNWQAMLIMIVFAVTGAIAVICADVLTQLIGLNRTTTMPWVFWPVRIVFIFPLYQILLVVIGALLGQYKFFWAFEKKMLQRLRLIKSH